MIMCDDDDNDDDDGGNGINDDNGDDMMIKTPTAMFQRSTLIYNHRARLLNGYDAIRVFEGAVSASASFSVFSVVFSFVGASALCRKCIFRPTKCRRTKCHVYTRRKKNGNGRHDYVRLCVTLHSSLSQTGLLLPCRFGR